MANSLLDSLNSFLWRKKKPTNPDPAPTPAPPTNPPAAVDYLKAWRLLKDIPIEKLGRAIGASGVVVFFAISGFLAWLLVFVKFLFALNR